MRTIVTPVFTFDELSEPAQRRAIEKHREFEACEFSGDYVIEDAERLGNLLGIEFYSRPVKLYDGQIITKPAIFWLEGDGACFEGRYGFAENADALIAKETGGTETGLIRIAQELEEIQKQAGFELIASMKPRGRHMNYMSVNVEREDNECTYDCHDIAIDRLMRDFADWIYDKLQKEYEFTTSGEIIIETIKANEYEFTANGELI